MVDNSRRDTEIFCTKHLGALRLNDRQLSSFLAVASAGSISRAAKEMFTTQQSLAYQLGTLEDELGYPLFERNTRGVSLTTGGRAFMDDAELILRTFHEAIGRSEGRAAQSRETLKVSLRSDAGPMILVQVCELFMKEHPEVDVRLVALNTSEQFRDIRSGAFDIMECPDSERCHVPGLGFTRVLSSPNVCLVRKADPLANKASLTLNDLANRQVCVQSSSKCFAAQRLRKAIEHRHPDIELCDIGYNAAQIAIASLSNVVIISPKAFACHNMDPAVQVLVPLEKAPLVDIGLVHLNKQPLPVIQKFIDTALSAVKELEG